jgi:hypothetical protein
MAYAALLWGRGVTEKFIKRFRRESAGVWTCVAPATIDLPQGRVQVAPGTRVAKGSTFMNVDLASLLDKQFEKEAR